MGRKRRSIFTLLNDKEWLEEKYKTLSTSEIGKIVGCSNHTVWYALRRLGIKTLNASERQRGRRNHQYGKPLSENQKSKMRKAMMGDKNPFYGKKHTSEAKRKISDNRQGMHIGWHHTDEHKQNMREIMRQKWQEPKYIKKVFEGLNIKPNKLERKVADILQRHYPGEWIYNGDFSSKVVIDGLIPDFVSANDKRIVIEVFGEVFHNPQKTFKSSIPWRQQESGRKATYSKFGYECIILWESNRDISEEYVVNKLGGGLCG